ncbi:MAG: tRNA 2-thiouridine(34) synthase MnmA [Patescibacteria group bacterium]|jgi:tRNA-specific 2-thiouridylase
MRKKDKILVALSGGVDSAVALYLLKKQGYDVEAAFMKNFSERVNLKGNCPWKEDRIMAYRIAAQLQVPIRTFNFEKEYYQKIVKYIFATYQKGQTPNPDILCNSEIKFKLFLDKAMLLGFDKIATGHYAKITKTGQVYHLLKATDKNKDQSYFLSGLSQKQLAKTIFPIGHLTKPKVRAIAKKAKLINSERPDSQGICFIGKINLKTFLQQKIKPKKGSILNTQGVKLGQHDGVWYYTIGQRKGLDLPNGPWFVSKKDVRNNVLYVAKEGELDLYQKSVKISKIAWLGKPKKLPFSAKAKIRYRQTDQNIILYPDRVLFKQKQKGVASGQSIVVYLKNDLIASATIL